MAASIQSQPPKPPPAPPKVESAPKADPKPAAEAKPAAQASAPKPAQTPDLFEQASGGGRGVPSNGGSSFTAAPAVTAAQAQIKDALSSSKATVQGAVNDVKSSIGSAVNGFKSDLQSAFGPVNDAVKQGPASDFQMAQDPAGFEGVQDDPLASMNDWSGFGDMMGGGAGQVDGGPTRAMSTGGAAGGVGDRSGVLNLRDTFSRNFGPWGGDGGFGGMLDGPGGGGKPGIGGGTDFLNAYGGGAGLTTPVQTAPAPAISTPPPSNGSSRSPFNFGFDFGGHGNGFHLGFFNFGSARGGGGGAAGGVADRSGTRSEG